MPIRIPLNLIEMPISYQAIGLMSRVFANGAGDRVE